MDLSIFKKKGWYVAVVVTLLCSLAGSYLAGFPYLKVIGALVLALIFGMLLQTLPAIKVAADEGIGFISNKFLRLGIIMLGFKLNLLALAAAGVKTIALAALVVAGMIFLTLAVCRAFKVDEKLAILASCGCGICGAAAVMGVSPQLKASSDDSVLSVAVVAILGTVFTIIDVIIFPHLGLTPTQFGVAAGASLHEIAHAVAAGGAGGPEALDIAIITKLSRVLMLIPVAIIAGVVYAKRERGEGSQKTRIPIPYFMLGFLATSAIGTFMPIPAGILSGLITLAYIFLGMAMAALGMSVNFKVIVQSGARVFGACALTSVILCVVSVCVSKIFF